MSAKAKNISTGGWTGYSWLNAGKLNIEVFADGCVVFRAADDHDSVAQALTADNAKEIAEWLLSCIAADAKPRPDNPLDCSTPPQAGRQG